MTISKIVDALLLFIINYIFYRISTSKFSFHYYYYFFFSVLANDKEKYHETK